MKRTRTDEAFEGEMVGLEGNTIKDELIKQ